MKTKFRRAALAAAVAGTFAGASAGVQAAGFALIEQNASGMGNAYAGAAAVAEDASTIFFNPAGMSLIEGPQLVVAGHVIAVSADFSGTGSRPVALGGGTFSGTGDPGDTAIVPNLYFSMPVNERMHVGIGVNVPFGLTTEYDDNWVGRFQGIKSELMTINVNPSISYKLSPAVSIGAGINYQQADVELTNASVTGAGEGRTKLEADDDAWGWNVGALFQVAQATRIGVSYRSTVDYSLEGNATTVAAGAIQPAGTFAAQADATFPDMFSLSLMQAMNDRLTILADATYTRWSELEAVRVVDGAGNTRDVLDFNFEDVWRYSIGANYMWNDQWILKAGLAYDQSPVKNAQTRTVRLPDNDRTWIALGAQAKVGQNGRVDLGYAHLFIKDADIDFQRSQLGVPAGFGDSRVTGTFEGSVDIFSVQYTHNF